MPDNRKRYTLRLAGIDHTVLLSDQAAARYGDLAKPVEEKQKPEPKKPAQKKK